MFKPGVFVTQYVIVIIANFPMMHMGLSNAWMSPVLVKLRDPNQTMLPEPVTEKEGAWIVSLGSLIGGFGILFAGYLSDNFGRRTTMLLGAVPRMAMSLLFIFASRVWMLLLARCFCGFADFISLSVTATYCSEIASKEIRGALGTLSQIMAALGAMIMLSIGPFLAYVPLNIMLACIIVLTFVPILFLPESPYYLQSKGLTEQSLKVLTTIRGSELKAREEMKEYSSKRESKIHIMDIVNDSVVLKTFARAVVLSAGSQMIGYTAISVYLQTILIMTGTSISPEISSLIIGCIELTACFCTVLLTDRFGRKPILGTSLVGMAVGMIGLGTFFTLSNETEEIVGFLNYLPVVSIILVVFCFNSGIGSLLWVQIAELFDGRYRALGVSVGVCSTSVVVFLSLRFFPTVTNAVGPALTYYIFTVCCLLFCMFIVFCIPESKGRTFSEIQTALGRKDKTSAMINT